MKNNRLFRNMIIVVLMLLTFWFGIRPVISGEEFEKRFQKSIGPEGENQYGLVVIGTEPEGIAAALSGARMGLKTLLVTEDMDPGSYIKSGLITYTSPDYAVLDGKKIELNTGIYSEFFGDTGGNFSYEDYIWSAKQMIEDEPNLKVLYNAACLSVQTEGEFVQSILIYHDGETRTINAPVFIDATENGEVLSLCNVRFFLGSADINVPDAYMPVMYNFVISNVVWDDIQSIRTQDQDMEDFQSVLKQYPRYSENTKITNLSFIDHPDDEMVISGIRMRQVNVNNPEKLMEDFDNALTEAKMLTAFLKTAFVPFENCSFKTGASSFYIPEYRHFEGRYILSVADILENRNFPTKVVMASAPVDAEKFVSSKLSEEYTYILGNPVVYTIPLECFISRNYDNLLMVGKKASFSSLAATSAGRMSVSITSGEAMGITAAYCYINDLTPVELAQSGEDTIKNYQNLLKRAGITLMDFDEQNPNNSHWAWPSVKVLVNYGLVAGGIYNDYLFDVEAYQENLVTLVINLIVKSNPEKYTLDLDKRIRSFSNDNILTGEIASEIILQTLNISYEKGYAFETANDMGLIPLDVLKKTEPNSPVTMDCVYALSVHIVNLMEQ